MPSNQNMSHVAKYFNTLILYTTEMIKDHVFMNFIFAHLWRSLLREFDLTLEVLKIFSGAIEA